MLLINSINSFMTEAVMKELSEEKRHIFVQ